MCERPGCSQPADVNYGIDADHLTVWIETFDAGTDYRAGVLCRRHADAMVVPLGWMLDDRRDPTPRLFRTREAEPAQPLKTKRTRRANGDDTAQLEFGPVDAGVAPEDTRDLERPVLPADEPTVPEDTVPPVEAAEADESPTEQHESVEPAWKPVFDQSDDLGGLLKAKDSRLLSRAFGKREPR